MEREYFHLPDKTCIQIDISTYETLYKEDVNNTYYKDKVTIFYKIDHRGWSYCRCFKSLDEMVEWIKMCENLKDFIELENL